MALLSIIPHTDYLQLEADCYSKSEGDARYWQTSDDLLQVNHPSDTRYFRIFANHTSNTQLRYRGSSLFVRRVNSSGSSSSVLTCNSTNQNVTFSGNVSSNALNSSSDRALKDNETPITAAEAGGTLDAVEAKRYARNDTG